jgi:ABC-type multidrug transport system fused ATPase/permease subunit
MSVFRKLKPFYFPYKHDFIWSLLLLLVVTGITVIYPIILQQTIDRVVLGGQYRLVPWMAAGFVVMMAFKAWAAFAQHYLADLFGIKSVRALRDALYEKLQRLPFRYYDNAKTGDLMSRLTSDVEGLRFFLAFGCSEALRFLIMVGASLIVMLCYSPRLTMVTVAALPFLAVAVYRFDCRVHPAFRSIRRSFAALNTKVQENISGIRTVKALAKERTEQERFDDRNGALRQSQLDTSRVWANYFPLMEAIGNICVVLLLAYGGHLVMANELRPGELVAFYSLTWYMLGPIMQLGFTINMFSQAKASGERLLEILEEKETINDSQADDSLTAIRGELEFRNVTLRYRDESAPALQDISFYAHPGKTIGLIGATGSGKSSLTQLIPRFYERSAGDILIDGRPIEQYPLRVLRAAVGVVMQETFLFSSTVKANIAYGRPEATMEEIVAAAKRAGAHEFIMELPDGYETVLGERGLGLSGGQRQRIAIARALCQNPSILILDDATSAVDMETERRIQAALREAMKGKTTFIIAHRISSLKHADEILVLDGGKIAERGTHEELLRHNGIYRRIYDIQYRDQQAVLHEAAR